MVKLSAALVVLTACPGNSSTVTTQPTGGSPGAGSAAAAPAAGSADITKPCTMITAAEVGAIVGFTVTATDEQFRCKFSDSKGGYLTLALMEASLRSAKEICEYAPDKRTVVAGVGDSASYFGATTCVKLGDVAIIVDGPNLAESSDALRKAGAENPMILIAKTVASRIP